ncbi:hypothetical protein JMY91_13565 [Brenneria goodwinii]|nr:hypothetical protein [Brenneria goodwinii]MCG8187404.1 hypothetical protein [Brenneria goodwinii]
MKTDSKGMVTLKKNTMNHAIINFFPQLTVCAWMRCKRCVFFEQKKSGYRLYELTFRVHYAAAE